MRTSATLAALALFLTAAPAAWAQAPLEVGHTRAHRAESPHPYPRGRADRPSVWHETIVSPGATFLRLHFRGFALAPGDYVTVSNPDGSQFHTYTGRGPKGNGHFWSFAVDGDTAIVEIHAGPRNGHGYRIDAIGHGTVDLKRAFPTPEVQCGTDGREDIVCHLPEVDAAQRPVARLLFFRGSIMYLCTGWLVDGTHPNTLITNNHCVSTQEEVDTLQVGFAFQHTTCGGSTKTSGTDYPGGTLLKTNSLWRSKGQGGLDYTLISLLGNPEATWGELVPSRNLPAVDDLIWVIQHPGGRPKEIGYWEDAGQTRRCGVDEVGKTYSGSAYDSQIGYACDTEGGSSGSPVIDAATEHVVALHHLGGVSSSQCLNGGTAMAYVCADAPSLLNCVGDDPPPPPPTSCTLGQKGDSCDSGADCCSGKCRGKRDRRICR
jgi:V8-like Glu-specific endopeptidase